MSEDIERSRGGLSTKLLALCDGLGNPVRLLLSEGQVHEMKRAHELCSEVRRARVLGDL